MSSRIAHWSAAVPKAQVPGAAQVARTRPGWHHRLDGSHEPFDEDVRRQQRLLRQSLARFIGDGSLASVATAPSIYSVIVPVVLLDAWMSLYQAICFRAYGIPLVRRSAYVVVDRHHLAYLNAIEKLNCAYCGYVNGVFAYVHEIASRTDVYWCPIRHARRVLAPHRRYRGFLDYGDAEGYGGWSIVGLAPARDTQDVGADEPIEAPGHWKLKCGLNGTLLATRTVGLIAMVEPGRTS
jgi:hypothetical protein